MQFTLEVHQLAEHWGVSIYRQARTDFGAGGRKRFGGVKGARRRVVEIKEDLAKVQYAAEDAPNGNEMKDAELERQAFVGFRGFWRGGGEGIFSKAADSEQIPQLRENLLIYCTCSQARSVPRCPGVLLVLRPMVSQELLKSHELCSRFRNVLAIVGASPGHLCLARPTAKATETEAVDGAMKLREAVRDESQKFGAKKVPWRVERSLWMT